MGSSGTILTSADGENWTTHQLETGIGLSGVAYGDAQFVVVGSWWNRNHNGTIMTSNDGANWIQRQPGTTNALYGIGYGNGRFVAVGEHRTIVVSGSIVTLSILSNAQTGQLTLSLEGRAENDYTIQTSTDLRSWRDLIKISKAQSDKAILDGLPVTSDRQFFRTSSQ